MSQNYNNRIEIEGNYNDYIDDIKNMLKNYDDYQIEQTPKSIYINFETYKNPSNFFNLISSKYPSLKIVSISENYDTDTVNYNYLENSQEISIYNSLAMTDLFNNNLQSIIPEIYKEISSIDSIHSEPDNIFDTVNSIIKESDNEIIQNLYDDINDGHKYIISKLLPMMVSLSKPNLKMLFSLFKKHSPQVYYIDTQENKELIDFVKCNNIDKNVIDLWLFEIDDQIKSQFLN
jgi:hypothetical protein